MQNTDNIDESDEPCNSGLQSDKANVISPRFFMQSFDNIDQYDDHLPCFSRRLQYASYVAYAAKTAQAADTPKAADTA